MNDTRDYYVTFDLWETLLIDRHEFDSLRNNARINGMHAILSKLGMKITLDALRAAYDQSAVRLTEIWERAESTPVVEQLRMIIKAASQDKFDLPLDPSEIDKLEQAYVDPLFEFPPALNPDAILTLQSMRRRVRKIGLVSNTGRSPGVALRKLMSEHGILRYFDATVFSDEVGCRKPDRRIFEAAMQRLGATAERTIHIGDDPNADIRGAKQSGMLAILFDYPVPEEFKQSPNSLFALSRASQPSDPVVEPDAKVTSLSETLAFLDSLK